MRTFLLLIGFLGEALTLIIFLRAILSCFSISPKNPIVVALSHVTEPIPALFRRVIPRVGMLSPPRLASFFCWSLHVLSI